MASDTPLTDDDVADILRREASRMSSPYLGSGSRSFASGLRSSAPKPNTRFLRNIIRDTDSHNAALKAREEAESRARLRRSRLHKETGSRSTARRHRDEDRASRRPHDHDRDRGHGLSRSRHTESRHHVEESSRPKRRKRDDGSEIRTRREARSRSRTRSRSPSPRRSRDSRDHQRKRHRRPPSKDRQELINNDPIDSDSETLDGGIGPLPPPEVMPRGRGACKASSIDTRFRPNYNPALDVEARPTHEYDDDWDMALRAVHDRAKWRKSRAERLLAAGFTDEEVQIFEKGADGRHSDEKDASDVRWVKQGEGREWDRGKIFNGNSVDIVPEWGRLKGT